MNNQADYQYDYINVVVLNHTCFNFLFKPFVLKNHQCFKNHVPYQAGHQLLYDGSMISSSVIWKYSYSYITRDLQCIITYFRDVSSVKIHFTYVYCFLLFSSLNQQRTTLDQGCQVKVVPFLVKLVTESSLPASVCIQITKLCHQFSTLITIQGNPNI